MGIENSVDMHRDFFDRCKLAIDNRFYIEAITMEYAAIESRLESICGRIGLPCGQKCVCRKDIFISSRIRCINDFWNRNKEIIARSKISQGFFSDKGILKSWIVKRDIIIHGLYKNATEYRNRIRTSRDIAERGYEYARLLYNEANRLGRLRTNHNEVFENAITKCKNPKCKANKKEK